MPAGHAHSNKDTFRRFHDAFANAGDAEFISKTVDEGIMSLTGP